MKSLHLKQKKEIYRCIKNLELLLWVCEASGVENNELVEAVNLVKQIIDKGRNGYARNYAGQQIKELIPWKDLEKY